MNRRRSKITQASLTLFPEWEHLSAVIYRYRGRVFLSCQAKRSILNRHITSQWQSAEAISARSNLPFHSATKLLIALAASGEVDTREECWIDERCRYRKRMLYRQHQDMSGSMDVLMRAFGMVCAGMRTEADYQHCRQHLLGG